MAVEEIGAKTGEMEEPIVVNYDVPATIDEAKSVFGEEVVYSRFKASLVIDLQAYMRSLMKAGKSEDEIKELSGAWKPGVRAPGKTTFEKARDHLSKLTADERAALVEELGLG